MLSTSIAVLLTFLLRYSLTFSLASSASISLFTTSGGIMLRFAFFLGSARRFGHRYLCLDLGNSLYAFFDA